MTLYSSIDTTPTNQQGLFYLLKTTLVSAGWTVQGSSDGTTWNNNAGADNYNSLAKANNAGSWVRLRDGNGLSEWAWIWSGSNWTVEYSAGAHFITGGSATSLPTASDQESFLSSQTVGMADGSYKARIVCGDSTWNYGFYLWTNAIGTNACNSCWVYDPIIGPAQDVNPYVTWQEWNNNTALCADIGINAVGSCWFDYGGANQAYVSQQVGACSLIDRYSGNQKVPVASGQAFGTDLTNGTSPIMAMVYSANNKLKGFSRMLAFVLPWGLAHGQILGPIAGQYWCVVSGQPATYPWIAVVWPNSTAPVA